MNPVPVFSLSLLKPSGHVADRFAPFAALVARARHADVEGIGTGLSSTMVLPMARGAPPDRIASFTCRRRSP